MKFIIIHGSFGHPGEHWFPPLKKALESIGEIAIVPTFPCDDWDELTAAGPASALKKQSLDSWFEAFQSVIKSLKKDEKVCLIGHSLGPVFILHLVDKYDIQLDSAIFVSPFLEKLDKFWQADKVNGSFYKTNFDFKKLKKYIPTSYVLHSDNDPYVEISKSLMFAQKMESSIILVKGAGHINNKNNFSLIYELCKTRIEPAEKK